MARDPELACLHPALPQPLSTASQPYSVPVERDVCMESKARPRHSLKVCAANPKTAPGEQSIHIEVSGGQD